MADGRKLRDFTLAAVLISVAAILAYWEENYHEPTGVNQREDDRQRGGRWLADCLEDPSQLYAESRLELRLFNKLADLLVERQLLGDGRRVSVKEKLLTFLYICGQGASWRNTKYRCGHSTSTITA